MMKMLVLLEMLIALSPLWVTCSTGPSQGEASLQQTIYEKMNDSMVWKKQNSSC